MRYNGTKTKWEKLAWPAPADGAVVQIIRTESTERMCVRWLLSVAFCCHCPNRSDRHRQPRCVLLLFLFSSLLFVSLCTFSFFSFCLSFLFGYLSTLNLLEPAPIFAVISYNEIYEGRYIRFSILWAAAIVCVRLLTRLHARASLLFLHSNSFIRLDWCVACAVAAATAAAAATTVIIV